jgi:hypothetical protein
MESGVNAAVYNIYSARISTHDALGFAMCNQPTFEMRPLRRGTRAGRLAIVLWVLAFICVVMAYATGGPERAHWVRDVGYVPAVKNAPNIIWFMIAGWFAVPAALVGIATWIFRN